MGWLRGLLNRDRPSGIDDMEDGERQEQWEVVWELILKNDVGQALDIGNALERRERELVADMFVSGLEGDDLLVELLTLLSHDNEDVQESMPPDELGGAQSWHPLCAFVMGAGDAIAKRMVVRVIDLVHHSSDPMVFFRAESALAAVTDCCNMPGMEAPLQELLPSVLNMAAHRLLDEHVFSSLLHDVSSAVGLAPSSRHPKEPDSVSEAAAFPDDDREVADERASTEDGGEGAESANSGEGSDSDASWYDDEPGTSSGFMAHVLRVISHRLPAAGYGYTFYPGFPPGTVIFCLERALSLKLGEELDHPRLPDLIGKLFRCMRGDANLHSHVASNAACTLTQIGHTPGGMAKLVTHPDNRRFGLAIAEILTMDPALLKGSQFIGIVAKLLASISETEEGAEWLFSLPRNVRRMAFQGILKQIGRVDDVTACSESAHALAQLLLYTDPDTDLGLKQRSSIYKEAEGLRLGEIFASVITKAVQNDGEARPSRLNHMEKYQKGLCASEEIAMCCVEMMIDKEGSTLLAKQGDALVEAAFKMLGSECVDNCSAGCNLIMRFCDSRAIWPPFLQPSPQRVQQIHAALFAVQGAHRDVLPAINRLFQKKGWVDAFVQNPDFEVFAAFLASEIELPGSDAASELTESRPHSHPDGIHRTSDRDVSANPRQSVHSDVSAEGYEVEQLMSNTSEDSDNMSSIGDHVSDDETSAFQDRDERSYASSWAAGTMAMLAAGSSQAGITFVKLPDFHSTVDNLIAFLKFDDVRSAAAAALGSLHNYSPLIGEKLQDLISEKTDGVSLALMECAGTQIPSLDESLRNLSLPEKRSWLATRLQQELKPFAAMATDTGPTQAATVAGHRDDVAAKLCQDVVSGQGLGSNLRAGVEVAFVNESGQGAAVLREWLCLVAQAFSSPDLGLLVSRNGGQSLHPCRFSEDICEDHHEKWYETLGRAIGVAIFHGVPFGCNLTHSCLRHLVGQSASLHDLEEMDPETYAHRVRFLESNNIDELELGLTFTDVADDLGIFRPPAQEVELCAGGSEQEVTDDNKYEYVKRLSIWRQHEAVSLQLNAIRRGVTAVVPDNVLKRCGDIMTPGELSSIIFGQREIDIKDWKENTKVEGHSMLQGAGQKVVGWFWEVVEDLQQADRQNLLQFATACTNVPVGGFAKLQSAHGVYHPFTIAELTGRSGSNVLPRAAACFNTLYLPLYATKEELASQLKIAIGMGKGMIDENALVVGTRAQDSADAGSSHGG